MDPQIQALLKEVPADFAPTFEAKPEDERVVGTLDSLDADTRRTIVAVLYFREQYAALGEAHRLEHTQEGFVPNGEACRKAHGTLAAFREKVDILQKASGRKLFDTFAFQPDEKVAFRTEGVTAAPPEPENPFLAMLQAMGAKVVIGGS